MKEYFRNFFNKSDNKKKVSIEFDGVIKFTLKIEDLIIGNLELKEKHWVFYYSEDFKTQNVYRRLAGFSDLEKTYESQVLWPFFKIRIPGLKQPMIREIIESEKLNKDDEASLLRRFGRVTMSNPYVLEPY